MEFKSQPWYQFLDEGMAGLVKPAAAPGSGDDKEAGDGAQQRIDSLFLKVYDISIL